MLSLRLSKGRKLVAHHVPVCSLDEQHVLWARGFKHVVPGWSPAGEAVETGL